ncbi:hypothetical protein L218DRAFT_927003 [Marasmius fiardii PR-910]|nr:hypothetical protein L218DRAFT_927003 [Marasmius fiardii PR-910]
MEVKYMWRSKFRLSTILYIFCRYALLTNLLYLLAISGKLVKTTYSCDTWFKIIGVLSCLGRAAVIVTFSARTYAVFSCSRWILVYFSVLGFTCIILNIVSRLYRWSTGQTEVYDSAILTILMLVFEYSSAALTVMRCVQLLRSGGPLKNQKSGFLYLIFQQGKSVFYFSVVSLLTTGALVLHFMRWSGVSSSDNYYLRIHKLAPPERIVNAFNLPLSGLLTARSLLHLREWVHKHRTRPRPSAVNRPSTTEQRSVLSEFRAAPGVLSTIIEDFGDDSLHQPSSSAFIEDDYSLSSLPYLQPKGFTPRQSSSSLPFSSTCDFPILDLPDPDIPV